MSALLVAAEKRDAAAYPHEISLREISRTFCRLPPNEDIDVTRHDAA